MAGYWADEHLDRITPPEVRDERGWAYLRTLDRLIADRPLSSFLVKDADTCPVAALPALIAEYSMEEFIEPDAPEIVKRRLLKFGFFLQSMSGTDAGVKLALSLIGLRAEITQWYRQDPMGAPNTHRITVSMDEDLFPDTVGYVSAMQGRAALRLIDATKRWSQESDVRTAVSVSAQAYVGVTSRHRLRVRSIGGLPPANPTHLKLRVGVATFGRLTAPRARCERLN